MMMYERRAPIPIFFFTNVKNVGDQINPWLLSRLFGRETLLSPQKQEHVLPVGSLMGFANEHSRIWGTGVLHPSSISKHIDGARVHALRGKLSYSALRASGVALPDVPLGDPGFLVRQFAGDWSKVHKSYRLGLAAHYVDRGHPWVRTLLACPEVADLNVHADPSVFLATLASCEVIVSSSLHGLIFAEALGVPNIWIELSDKVLGDGFKFRDWFSLAALPQNNPETPQSIQDTTSLIEKARLHEMRIDVNALIESFPFDVAPPPAT